MTTTTAGDHPAAPDLVPRHSHTRSCYWDHRRAGWVCPGPPLGMVTVTPGT